MSIEYDPALVEQVAHILDLRAPNAAALDAIARRLEAAEPGAELVADLATGVGKTYIAGGLLDYLAASGVRNVVIVTPGSTIQAKTVANLTPGSPKYLRGLRSDPLVITLDDLERGTVAAALEDPDRFKVFVFTVQSLLRPDTRDARRAHRAHETLGVALYEYLQGAGDLVVIADEHHVYYSRSAKKFRAAIEDLHPAALIGLTATPHEASEPAVVYRYPLAEAIADGYVKIPVLVARPDGAKDLRTQMADGVALLDAKTAAVDAYCTRTRKPRVRPVLFVVAQTIDEATDLRDMLAGPDLLGSPEEVLLVTSDQPDATLAELDRLEDPGSRIRAVVSVSMLKEGWDVKSIYVIAAVRAMESQLLTEQILGRGLRLPFGARTGVPMLDTVEVLSHHAFTDLLKQADVLLQETLGQRAEQAQAVVDPRPGRRTDPVPTGTVTTTGATGTGTGSGAGPSNVTFVLPGTAPAAGDRPEEDQDAGDGTQDGDDGHVGLGIATLTARLDDAAAAAATISTPLAPTPPAGLRLPLYLPQVTTRWVRDPFSLAQLNLLEVEAQGARFAEDNGPALTRKALDATRTDDGAVRVVISDQAEAVQASQTLLPFDHIPIDLTARLLRANEIPATLAEANAATGVAAAFLKGAGVTPDTPWRAEHGRLATAALLEWIGSKRASRPVREVTDVTLVRWPDPAERTELQPPADRHTVAGSRDFVRGYPYAGWGRGVYPVSSFDAYSTEFRLASMFETSPGVRGWARITSTVPLRITYLVGAIQRSYEPDFIVFTDDGTRWIVEGKADSEMTDPVVLAKADAARAWVAAVNASTAVADRWAYLIASESVIAAAGNWAALTTAAAAYR